MEFVYEPLYIITLRGLITFVRFMFVTETQILGYTEDEGQVILSKFGNNADSHVSIVANTPDGQNICYVGNNTNIKIFSDKNEAESAQRDLILAANLIQACKKVKEDREN